MRKFAYTVLLTGGFMVALGGCATAPQGKGPHDFSVGIQKPEVVITVNKNATELNAQITSAHGCKSGAENCIRVLKDNVAEIGFKLAGPPGWQFSEMRILPVATESEKNACVTGTTRDIKACWLSPLQRAEFSALAAGELDSAPLAPTQSGVIDLAALSCDPVDAFTLIDLNLLAQNYFYTVKVCNDSEEPACLELDPPLENDGKGDGGMRN